jgi:hypothetical protein
MDLNFLFFSQKFMNDFLDLLISTSYFFYKIFNIIFLNNLYYITRLILINIINFIHTILSNKFILKFISLKNIIRDIFIYYNTRILKLRKRYTLYFRLGKFKNVKGIFYITFFIILIYIWQNRNLYRYNYPIRYYFYYLFSFMLLSIIFYGILDNWFLSEILALFISFTGIYLTLK